MAISLLLIRSSRVPLMRSFTLSLRKAAATTASPLGRRQAATGTHGRTRWRATRGCTTSRRSPWKNLRTETSWPWSTAGSPLSLRSAACCKNSTEPFRCLSGPASIQTQEANLEVSLFPGTAGSTPSWLLPLLHRIRGSITTTSWTRPETQVRLRVPSNQLHIHQ